MRDKKTISRSTSALASPICIFLGIVGCSLVFMSIIYRFGSNDDNMHQFIRNKVPTTASSLLDSNSQYNHIKKLYDETKSLLHDISLRNITVSKQTQDEIDILQSERKMIAQEIESLQHERNHMQSNFAECVIDKHKMMNDYESCEEQRIKLQQAADAIHHREHHLIEENDFNISSFNGLEYNPRSYEGSSSSDKPTLSSKLSSSSHDKKWLVVGIPTMARPNNEDYLLHTLSSIASQLPSDLYSLLYHQVLIAVVHVEPSPTSTSWGGGTSSHTRYEEAKKLYMNNPYFIFLELSSSEVYHDPIVGSTAVSDVGNANHPGYRVRKQSRNLAAVIKKVSSYGKYYLFLEDDMEFCPYVIHAIQYMIDKTSRYHPNWLAIRASYGMNGIIMRHVDAVVFADYLVQHQARRPPDHLVVEWYAGESAQSKQYRGNRANIGYRYNLFNHIGYVSTLRSAKQTSFPVCYDMLLEPTVFQVEAFSVHDCPKDDIWPCNIPHAESTYVHWDQVTLNQHI